MIGRGLFDLTQFLLVLSILTGTLRSQRNRENNPIHDGVCKTVYRFLYRLISGSNSRNCASPRSAFIIFFPLLGTWLLATPPEIRNIPPNCGWYSNCERRYKPRLCRQFFISPPVFTKDKRKYISDQS
jgi:hypothetical protein